MKVSKFNSTLPYRDNFLLHNTYSDHFILIQPILKELLEAAVSHGDVGGLKDYHPGFYKELFDNNFIVEESLDENQLIKDLSKRIDGTQSQFLLTINPTMGCNFKCWYCYETHIQGSKMETPIIDRVLKFIENEKNHNPNLEYFNISFFGGEPLIYYRQAVVPILEGAKEIFKDGKVNFGSSFTTNGYLVNQEKIDFLKAHNVFGMQITLDGNKEFHNKVRYVNENKGSYEKIISNIKLLARNDMQVTMRINFTRDNFVSCLDIADDFHDLEDEFKQNVLVDFHQVWQDQDDGDVSTTPATDKFRTAGFPVRSAASLMNNVVESCYADKVKSAVFNYNGEVFKCTARDFTTENSLGLLNDEGNIDWKPAYHRRLNAKFNNAPCLECRLLPLCNGGCSEHAFQNLDKEGGYCVYNFDESKKDEIILERFNMRAMSMSIE